MNRPTTLPAVTDVFISYSRADQDFVRRLYEALEKAGRGAWVDWEGIPPSAEWLAEIYGAIEAADSFVFVLSPDSVASTVCGLEVAHAANRKKRLIPVVARECNAETVPEALRRLNWVQMRPTDDFPTAFAMLLEALDTDLPWVKNHTRILLRASEWDAKGRDSSLLVRGKDLNEAERWLSDAARHPSPEPSPLQLEFIVASRRADTRRQRIVLGSTVAALAISTVLAIWAVRERNDAQRQTQLSVANNLLVESQSERHVGASGAQLRILLAVESLKRLLAQRRASTDVLETVDAVASLRARKLGAVRMDNKPGGVVLSARGDRVATWNGKAVAVRHTLGMSDVRRFDADGDVTAAAFTPLATTLAVATNGVIRTYDLSAGDGESTSFNCHGRPYAVWFDGTGKHLAALTIEADKSTRLCLWSTKPQQLLAEMEIPNEGEERYGELAFSAASKFLAALLPSSAYKTRLVLFDVESGKQRRSWDLNARQPKLAFRGETLVIAEDRAVWGWNALETREDSRWNLDEKWRAIRLSPDGRFAIVVQEETVSWVMDHFSYVRVGVHDTAGGIELAQMAHMPSGFTIDGRFLVDGAALLQIPSMRVARLIPASARDTPLLISSDSAVAVSVTPDNELRAWKLADAPELASVALEPGTAEPRAFSPRAPWFAVASNRNVRLINLSDPSKITQTSSPHRIDALAFSEDAHYLSAIADGHLMLWALPGLTTAMELTLRSQTSPGKECGLLDAVCKRAAERPWLKSLEPYFLSRDARFVAWASDGELKIWSVPDGRLVHSARKVGAKPVLLESGIDLLIGHTDGRVTVLDTEHWKSRADFKTHAGRIDTLVSLPRGEQAVAITRDEQFDFSGQPSHRTSSWHFSLFSLHGGAAQGAYSGHGILGPWSPDGTRVAVQPSQDRIDILNTANGAQLRAAIELSKSVAQRARSLAFTSDGNYLLVESETPITFGRAEPTLHVIRVDSGREILRMPARDMNKDSISLDRTAPYPDAFLVDAAHDLVASVVYPNADAYWSVAAGRAEKRLTVWKLSPAGELLPLLRSPVSDEIEPVSFVGGGRFLATVPRFRPDAGEAGAYAIKIWSVGLEERLQLACAAADGNLPPLEWNRYVGNFTGEAPRATCEALPY